VGGGGDGGGTAGKGADSVARGDGDGGETTRCDGWLCSESVMKHTAVMVFVAVMRRGRK